MPETTRQSPYRVVQISAMDNGCFALCDNGRVYVCVYDSVIDEWMWHETRNAPGSGVTPEINRAS